jgi:ATP-dependent Lon protease
MALYTNQTGKLKGVKEKHSNEQHSLSVYNLIIQISNLMRSQIFGGIGSVVYVSILSAIYKKNLKPGLVVLRNISIGGAVEKASSFAEKVTLLSENGAKTVLVPMENLNEMTTFPSSILCKTDTPFYGNSQMLLQKAVLGE